MNIQILIEALRELLIIFPVIILTITAREYIEGYIAFKLGDTTAKDARLLNFNPLNFIDGLGLILFIAFGYGWSKNIPIDYRKFKKPIWYLYIEIAGILFNLITAFFFILLIILYRPSPDGYIYHFFMNMIKINLNYFLISFFPILPLTCGRVISILWEDYSKLEFLCILFFVIFFILGGGKVLDKIVMIPIKIIE
jgi:hypothetical protein